MKKLFLSIGLLVSAILLGQSGDHPCRAVSFNLVKLADKFLLPGIQASHTVPITGSFENCELYNAADLYELAAADHLITGNVNLRNIAIKFAGLVLNEKKTMTAIPYYAWANREEG